MSTRDYYQVTAVWLNGGHARRLRIRTWWRRRHAVNDNCTSCGTLVRMLPGTTAWSQHLCETCARTTR